MKRLTLNITSDDGTTIHHEVLLQNDSTWLFQIEAMRTFMLAQGYLLDDRIAIVEPDFSGMQGSNFLYDVFYEQLQEAGWGGEVVPHIEIKE